MKAVIYNKYLPVLGGGERSALAYGSALQQLGYEAAVVTTGKLPEASRIRETFGSEFDNVPLVSTHGLEISTWLRKESPDVFVNHTFQDFTPCPGGLGIYSQMFPTVKVQSGNRPRESRALATYQMLLNNSSFTKRYTDLFWDYPVAQSQVIHPPIGQEMSDRARRCAINPPAKERLFLGIGRFAVYPANKNQKVMIEGFLEARRNDQNLRDWRLVLVGNRNPDEESRQYCCECLELAAASGGAVEIHHELPQKDLIDLLERAFGYVHAAGAFLPPGLNPHQCEHLGLSIVEGMAYGCIPLLYARGGVFDILDTSRAGFPYATPGGLVTGFSALASIYGSPEHLRQQKAVAQMADLLSFEQFTEYFGQAMEQAKSITQS